MIGEASLSGLTPDERLVQEKKEAAEQTAALELADNIGPSALRREARPIGTTAIEIDGIILLPPAVPTPLRPGGGSELL